MLAEASQNISNLEATESALLSLRGKQASDRLAQIRAFPSSLKFPDSLVEALGFSLIADPDDAVKKAVYDKLFGQTRQLQNPLADFLLLQTAILMRGGFQSKEPMMRGFISRYGEQAKMTFLTMTNLSVPIGTSADATARIVALCNELMGHQTSNFTGPPLPGQFRWQGEHTKIVLQRAGMEHLQSRTVSPEDRVEFLRHLLPLEEIRPFQFILLSLVVASGDSSIFGLFAKNSLRSHSTKHADILARDALSSIPRVTA